MYSLYPAPTSLTTFKCESPACGQRLPVSQRYHGPGISGRWRDATVCCLDCLHAAQLIADIQETSMHVHALVCDVHDCGFCKWHMAMEDEGGRDILRGRVAVEPESNLGHARWQKEGMYLWREF